MGKENKAGLEPKVIETIKEDLLKQKAKILHDLKDLSRSDEHEADDRAPIFPNYGDKPDENAQEISEYTTNLATEKILEKSLEDIEKSLKRIDDGTYGTCQYCGKTIGEKRLLARPVASACIDCKTKLQNS
jgi:DnaK suppressor protein